MILDLLSTWALVSVSLFNTILLLWLGITLWLNADRHDAGIAVTTAGYFLGSACFAGHAALLLSDSLQLTRSNTLWLAVASAPVVVLPYVWYVVLLRYNGFFETTSVDLRQRHRPWLGLLAGIMALGLACLALLGMPYIPVFRELTPWAEPLRELVKIAVFGVPLVALAYPLYVLACVLLSLEALRRPGVAVRLQGDVARNRARPWLAAASWLLTIVSALGAIVLVWTITNTGHGGYYVLTHSALAVIGWFDLAISLLIAAVVLMLGQAMTAYELFTEKTLPRQGLARQWRSAILLAGSYGALMGGALAWGLQPEYGVLLTALLMTVFFATLSWRSAVEREEALRHLRPLVASQRWYEALVAQRAGAAGGPDPFGALCQELLGVEHAYLVPVGPSGSLVDPQSYPAGRPVPSLGDLVEKSSRDDGLILPVDPARFQGATWAVALWREQGLAGVLLFGPRRDGSLFKQEEIEIARSTAERLIDLAAGVSLSRRLMALQRERMAAGQILDQGTRRALHDEVLPLIHTAMLSLASGARPDAAMEHLSHAHQEVSNLLRSLPPTVAPEIARLGLLGALQRMLNVEFASAFDEIAWDSDPAAEAQAASLSPLAAETVYYAAREAIRNAARHARRPTDAGEGQSEHAAALRLEVTAHVVDGRLRLAIGDNGPGMPATPGDGQGLALHSTLMAVAGGSLAIDSAPDRGTCVVLAIG